MLSLLMVIGATAAIGVLLWRFGATLETVLVWLLDAAGEVRLAFAAARREVGAAFARTDEEAIAWFYREHELPTMQNWEDWLVRFGRAEIPVHTVTVDGDTYEVKIDRDRRTVNGRHIGIRGLTPAQIAKQYKNSQK